MNKWTRSLLILSGLLVTLIAQSHQISTAYLTLDTASDELTQGQYQVKLKDLAYQLNLDINKNQSITWGEIKAQRPAITEWFHSNLGFSHNDSSDCVSTIKPELLMDSHFNEPYLVIEFAVDCGAGKPTALQYQGMFELNSGHKMIAIVDANGQQSNRIISAENRSMNFNEQFSNTWKTIKDYVYQGVIHILIGLDHIMFLLCLLLSTVMILNHSKQLSNKATVWHVMGLVTAFTLAHSVTLVLTALNLLSFPSRWVEIIIALTVAATAFNNIMPFIRKMILVTFLFGLVHGMGFAGVLGELGLPSGARLVPILAFNLGVEFGQVFLIVLILPILLWTANQMNKAQLLFKFISLMIMLLAIYWVVERY